MRFPILASVMLLAGCPGLGQVGFDVDSTGRSTIQGSAAGGLLPAFPGFTGFGSMSFSQDQTFSNNNTNKDHVSSCRTKKLTLKIVSPTGANLSFISAIEFHIQAPNLPDVKIAELSPIPAGATIVELNLDDVELAPYAKADSFSITTKGTASVPPQDTTIEADLTLHIVANVL
ncbi:MAG: hypothetical protein ABR567_06855 [Myxococcales bacterium]|nr:hypothetical protein [Myxococcales bacterium]